LTTATYRSDAPGGGSYNHQENLYNYSYRDLEHPTWQPAADLPERIDKSEYAFETDKAKSYDAESGAPSGPGSDRTYDSEPRMFEDLLRRQLSERSGLTYDEVDQILRNEAKPFNTEHRDTLRDRRVDDQEGLPPKRLRDKIEYTQKKIDAAIEKINNEAAAAAARDGRTYQPFTREDFSGDLRLVVDLPSARADGTPARYQVCSSCSDVILAYERAFPNMRVEVQNLAGEQLT
jgi:hypothetical protein